MIPREERNYGVDMLRIVAMLMVCFVHINWYTRVHVDIYPDKEGLYYFGVWSQSTAIIGVNLYAMITGYVSVLSKWKFSRYVRLWLLVAFYTVFICGVGFILDKCGVLPWPEGSVTRIIKYTIRLFFGSTYWYFIAYTGLFFTIPFLNKALRIMQQGVFIKLLICLVVLLPIIGILGGMPIYGGGYNMTWLIVMYVVGAYVKLYPPHKLRTKWLLVVSVVSTLQPVIFVLLGLPSMISYTCPIVIAYSISLFIVFSRLNISSPIFRRVVAFLASASFSVYLIQSHPWTVQVIRDKYVAQVFMDWGEPWWYALCLAIIKYAVCASIDQLRLLLFSICRADRQSDRIATLIENPLKKFVIRVQS